MVYKPLVVIIWTVVRAKLLNTCPPPPPLKLYYLNIHPPQVESYYNHHTTVLNYFHLDVPINTLFPISVIWPNNQNDLTLSC